MTRAQRPSLVRPIVLIGLMGAGKSSVGARLAATLGAEFRDSDQEIERAAAMGIPEIFERHGEHYFREGERRVIARLLAARPHVLATGGGAFLNEETRALIGDKAVSVWLRAPLDVLIARTKGRTHRPLLNRGDPREILAHLISERYPVYSQADVTVDSRLDQTHDEMVGRILDALRDHEQRTGQGALAPAEAE